MTQPAEVALVTGGVDGGVKMVENRRFEIPCALRGSHEQGAGEMGCRLVAWA
jgi:hypothetical protein